MWDRFDSEWAPSAGGDFVNQLFSHFWERLLTLTPSSPALSIFGAIMNKIKDFSEHYNWLKEQKQEFKKPIGLVQWKGTDVCIDLHCSCGNRIHIDDYFVYYFRCHCGKTYALDNTIHLIELDELHTKYVMERSPNVVFHSCEDCEGGNKTVEISPNVHQVQCDNPKCKGRGYYTGERMIDPDDPTRLTFEMSVPVAFSPALFKTVKPGTKQDADDAAKELVAAVGEAVKGKIGDLPKQQIAQSLKNLTSDQRIELFSEYCKYCGDEVPPRCYCMNDE